MEYVYFLEIAYFYYNAMFVEILFFLTFMFAHMKLMTYLYDSNMSYAKVSVRMRGCICSSSFHLLLYSSFSSCVCSDKIDFICDVHVNLENSGNELLT